MLLVAFFAAGSISMPGQESGQDQKGLFQPSVKFALEVDDAFEFVWWSVGMDLDYHIDNTFMISPELTGQGYKFDFDWFMLYPGATFNVKFGKPGEQFFAGAGALLVIPIEPGDADTELLFKMNVGFMARPIKITLYLWTPFEYFFETNSVMYGLSLGYML